MLLLDDENDDSDDRLDDDEEDVTLATVELEELDDELVSDWTVELELDELLLVRLAAVLLDELEELDEEL